MLQESLPVILLGKRLRKRKSSLVCHIFSNIQTLPSNAHYNYNQSHHVKEETKTKKFQVFLHASHQDMFSFNFSHFKRTFCDKHEKEIHAVKPFSQL